MKKLLPIIGLLAICVFAYVTYQYQQNAGAALEQIAQDKHWLRSKLPEQQNQQEGPFADLAHHEKKWVQTELVQQGVNDQRMFMRIYNSLFILNGQRSCLRTALIYPNREATIEDQRWLDGGEICLP